MDNKHAMLIGYGPGVGHAVTEALAREGMAVSIFARNPAKNSGWIDELRKAGFSVNALEMDAGSEGSIVEGMQKSTTAFGAPSVLVYNAVAFRMAKPSDLKADQLIADFQVNVAGALTASREFVRLSADQPQRTILLTGGGWSLYPDPAVASTAIGKAGLRSLGLMLHDDLKPLGVRVGMVTIMGGVQEGTSFDPARIAKSFMALYNTPNDAFPAEVKFTGG